MILEWSAEIPFTQDAIRKDVPSRAGVYQFLQSEEYPRYKGKTRVLKIGESSRGLRGEILNHQTRHTAANRLARIRKLSDAHVSVIYALILDGSTKEIESELLRQFEDSHWDLPMLNSNRGYGRDTDKHYRE